MSRTCQFCWGRGEMFISPPDFLPDKDVGQLELFFFSFFFPFMDWWIGINKRTLHYHFGLPCQVLTPRLHSAFALHLSDLTSSCFPSVPHIRPRVRVEMPPGHSTKKHTTSLTTPPPPTQHPIHPPSCRAFVCHFSSAHPNMCKGACTCFTCTRRYTSGCYTLHLTHTEAGLYGSSKARKQGCAH